MDEAIKLLILRLLTYLHSSEYENRMWNNEIDPELQSILEELDNRMGLFHG